MSAARCPLCLGISTHGTHTTSPDGGTRPSSPRERSFSVRVGGKRYLAKALPPCSDVPWSILTMVAAEELGVFVNDTPMYPEYSSEKARWESFEHCPTAPPRIVQMLTQAGFYFVRLLNTTACFYCGCMVKKWGAYPNPWLMHESINPNCRFLLSRRTNENWQEGPVYNQCKICLCGAIETVFLPCGHAVSCGPCSVPLTSCVVCREEIKAVKRIFLA